MKNIIIKVSKDFSTTPGARYYDDGEDSGEEFFDRILKDSFQKALDNEVKLVIDLDGTEGYATSFLDEMIVRLVSFFTKETVKNNIIIISNEEPDWIEEIEDYINEA